MKPPNHKPNCGCVVCKASTAPIKEEVKPAGKPAAKGPAKSAVLESREEECFEPLPVPLTAVELEAVQTRVCFLVGEIADKEGELEGYSKTIRGEIKALEQQLATQAKKARDKVEYRETRCKRVFDYVRLEVRKYRIDTGALLSTKEMTGSERNLELVADGKTFKALAARGVENEEVAPEPKPVDEKSITK